MSCEIAISEVIRKLVPLSKIIMTNIVTITYFEEFVRGLPRSGAEAVVESVCCFLLMLP